MFLIYIGTFMFFFFLLSIIGTIWVSYYTVISEGGWWMIYSLFLGWWIAIFPAMEYYHKHKAYFNSL